MAFHLQWNDQEATLSAEGRPHVPADEHWAEALPLVLLGIRSAWKEDLKASSN